MPTLLANFNLNRRLIMATETSSLPTVSIGAETWVASLWPTLAVYEAGNYKGRTLAKQNLQRMAELADLAYDAIKTIERMVVEEHAHGEDVRLVMAEARRLSNTRPTDSAPDQQLANSPAASVSRPFGVLAKKRSNLELPLEILYCTRGFYIGTSCDAQPYTHESKEYWTRRELAVQALRTGDWTQRVSLADE